MTTVWLFLSFVPWQVPDLDAEAEPGNVGAPRGQLVEVENCGVESLRLIVSWLGRGELRNDINHELASKRIVALSELREAVTELGLYAEAVRWPDRRLPRGVQLPAILLLGGLNVDEKDVGHFVVVIPDKAGAHKMIDFPWGPASVIPEKLATRWDGTALYVGTDRSEFSELHRMLRRSRFLDLIAMVGAGVLGVTVLTAILRFRQVRSNAKTARANRRPE